MLLISIIIPVYNRTQLIRHTLNSILKQTYTHIECIVVDDGSEDKTLDVIREYVSMDNRILLLERPMHKEKGASSCRNWGIVHAKGDLLCFFDSDDIMLPNALETRIAQVQRFPNFDFWVFQTQRFFKTPGDDLAIWNNLSKPNQVDLDDFLGINPVWHTSGVLWKHSFLNENGLQFYEPAKSWQDWEFHIRILLKQPLYKKFPEVPIGVLQRFHEKASISKLNSKSIILNRLDTVRMLADTLKKSGNFEKPKQFQIAKLVYFLTQSLPLSVPIMPIWFSYNSYFKKLHKLELWFWSCYLAVKRQQNRKGYFRLYKSLQYFKKLYFSKRLAMDDFSMRTWYKQH